METKIVKLKHMFLADGETEVFNNAPDSYGYDCGTGVPGYAGDPEYDSYSDDWFVHYGDQNGGEVGYYWSCRDDEMFYY